MTNTDFGRMALTLLRDAQVAIENGAHDRAAWRLADAGGWLRKHLERAGEVSLAGLDDPTGLGCTLPTIAEQQL